MEGRKKKAKKGDAISCSLWLDCFICLEAFRVIIFCPSILIRSRPRQEIAVQQWAQHIVQHTVRDVGPPETDPVSTRPAATRASLLLEQAHGHVPVERGAGSAEEAGGDLSCVCVFIWVRRNCDACVSSSPCIQTNDPHATTYLDVRHNERNCSQHEPLEMIAQKRQRHRWRSEAFFRERRRKE